MSEWVELLSEALQGYVPTVVPASTKGSSVIFCKLCEQIRSCTAILSEVTDLNRNVLFEHGFALATGCRGVLLRRKGSMSSKTLDVFHDIERMEYDSYNDVVEHVAGLTEAGLSKSFTDTGQAKFLGDWDFSNQPIDFKRISFLRLQQPATDAVRRISKVINGSSFALNEITDEHQTHRLHDYCRQILESFAIVGHFVSDDRVTNREDNALTALLLGISLGFGRRIMVLQEEHCERPMIDLGGVVHPYTKLRPLQDKLEAQLQVWWHESSAEQVRQAQLRSDTETRISIIQLGSAAAENDELLERAFYPTTYSQWAETHSKFLIIGRKGSGKSALYRHIRTRAQDSVKRKHIFIEPSTLEIERMRKLSERIMPTVSLENLLRSFWRFNLVIDFGLSILEDVPPALDTDDDVVDLRHQIGELGVVDENDYAIRFSNYLEKQCFGGQITNEHVSTARLIELESLVSRLWNGFQFHVYADRLDEEWRENDLFSRELVRSFVHECFALKLAYSEIVKPTVFLLTDILESVRQGDREGDKWDIGEILWTREELRQMLESRIRVATVARGGNIHDVDWFSVLPAIGDDLPVNYLLDRTLRTPRDAINLLQLALDRASAADKLPAESGDVRRALRRFSEDRLLNLKNEVGAKLPDLDKAVAEMLTAFDSDMNTTLEHLRNHLRVVAGQGAPQWIAEPAAIAWLYDVGILCSVNSAGLLVAVGMSPFSTAIGGAQERQIVCCEPRFSLFGARIGKREVMKMEKVLALHPAFHALVGKYDSKVMFAE